MLLVLLCANALANTPAGTIIRNQASAVYTDESGQQVTVTSNIVETVINQVAGLELTQDQQKLATAGSVVSFPHRLSNTGNGDDRYNLQINNASGDTFDLNNLGIYLDLNQDGVADSTTPVTISPWVPAGTDLFLVISGLIPGNVNPGDAALVTLTAQSQFNSALSKLNTDTVRVNEGAVVNAVKTISSNAGVSPSGPYTVTLKFKNSGTAVANQVTLIDALPYGMEYVPGSGRWNLSTQALTDVDPNDAQPGGSTVIRYCAYDSSCVGLQEAQLDPDTSSVNQVTAIIESLQAGETGTVSFDINITPQLSAGLISNQAEMEFDSAGATTPRVYSNVVNFEVLPSAAVVANGSVSTPINGMNEPVSVSSAPLAGTVEFENIIWNTGNAVDTFNMEVDLATTSFPVNTIYRLLKADAATPLFDTNQDGIVDTGPINPGEFANVVMQLQLPFGVSGNNNGAGFDIRKIATSVNDAAVFDDVVDHLDEIVSNQVDLTNQYPAGTAGALGVGPGPEVTPVSTVTIDANGLAGFDLHVRHQGSVPSSYDISSSADALGGALPSGWQVVFTDAQSGTVLTNTGMLNSGESRHLVAKLSVPLTPTFDQRSIYFKVVSPQNGASDIKHDAVKFVALAGLNLEPDLSAQVNPGGSVVYEHVITNTGNIDLSDIVFSVQQTNSNWQSTLYADTDQNGFLSPGDLVISGSMSLLSGESADIFLKVFAPGNAPMGQNNISTVVASSQANTVSASIQDVTTVSESQVSIRKEQAVDVGCDGQPDVGSNFSPAQIDVAPGNNCVIYRLTAVNNGAVPSYNVVIHDYTPPYTLYSPAATCSRTPCWVNEPDAGETGTINAETDQLLPGDSYFLQFSVQVQ